VGKRPNLRNLAQPTGHRTRGDGAAATIYRVANIDLTEPGEPTIRGTGPPVSGAAFPQAMAMKGD
jgi:hypothetical protein